MQVALPLGHAIEKQTMGLAALVLAGMVITPVDLPQVLSDYTQPRTTLTVVRSSETSERNEEQAKRTTSNFQSSSFQELQSEQKYRISILISTATSSVQELTDEKLAIRQNNQTSQVLDDQTQAIQTPAAQITNSSQPKIMARETVSTEPGSLSANPELRSKIIESALSWAGTPYLYGGESRAGVDCSALVQMVYQKYGVTLPRSSRDQYRQGVGIAQNELLPGDLVFFSTNGPGASHVGIYLGDNRFISATKRKVEIQALDDKYWTNTYHGSRRVLN